MSTTKPEHDKVLRFDSPQSYANYFVSFQPHDYVYRTERMSCQRDGFSGGSFNSALDRLINGSTDGLADAERIIDKMRDQHIFVQGQPIIESDVVGYCPNVPAVLMGHPHTMLVRSVSEQQTEHTPIRIFVETTVSCDLSHKELINRGVAVLALTLALNMTRPIELYAASFGKLSYEENCDVYGAIVRIDTKPLDLNRAVFMLTSPAYCRRLAFCAMHLMANYWHEHSIPFPTDCRDLCSCEDQDILIPGGRSSDRLLLSDPIEWVKRELAKHSNVREAA